MIYLKNKSVLLYIKNIILINIKLGLIPTKGMVVVHWAQFYMQFFYNGPNPTVLGRLSPPPPFLSVSHAETLIELPSVSKKGG